MEPRESLHVVLTDSASPQGTNTSHVCIVSNWQLLNWQSLSLWACEATVIGIYTWRQQHLLVSSWVFELSEQEETQKDTDIHFFTHLDQWKII